MKKYKQINLAGAISLLLILALELLFDHGLEQNNSFCFFIKSPTNPCYIWIYICLALLPIGIFANRKHLKPSFRKLKGVIKTLIKNSVSGSGIDILFVIFFLLHLTWIPDSIYEWTKGGAYWGQPLIFVLGMLGAVMIKPQMKKETSNNPLVLLTGISIIDEKTVDAIIDPLLKEKAKNEYNPEDFEKIIVFVDKYIKIKSLDGLSEKGLSPDTLSKLTNFDHTNWTENGKKDIIRCLLKDLIRYSFKKQNVDIELIDCSYNKIQSAFDIISTKVNELLSGKYTDKQLMFNITPGNKIISIALALNSIQRDRQTCYIQQTPPYDIEAEELNIFKLKDIVTEILD